MRVSCRSLTAQNSCGRDTPNLVSCYNIVRLSRMRLASPILKRAVYPALHRLGRLDRSMPIGGYSVVNYHGVAPADYSGGEVFLDGNLVQAEVFRQQIQFLKSRYQIVHPEDFRAWIERGQQLPPRAVLLSRDDGLVNTLTDMLLMLQTDNVSPAPLAGDGQVSHRDRGEAFPKT
jgi:hypothetical protein